MIRGEPSVRLNVVQEEMSSVGDRYEILKELLKDEEFRRFSSRVLEIQTRVKARHRSGTSSGQCGCL